MKDISLYVPTIKDYYYEKKIEKNPLTMSYNAGYNEYIIACNKYNVASQGFYKKMGGEVICIDEDMTDKSIPQMIFLYKI